MWARTQVRSRILFYFIFHFKIFEFSFSLDFPHTNNNNHHKKIRVFKAIPLTALRSFYESEKNNDINGIASSEQFQKFMMRLNVERFDEIYIKLYELYM